MSPRRACLAAAIMTVVPPVLFDITDRVFNEDDILSIPIVIRQDTTDIIINSDDITAFDPDESYNTIDIEVNAATLNNDLSATIVNDSLFIIPSNNINGNYQIDIIARENYDLHENGCGTCPDPPLEDIQSFNITINSINDAPNVVSILDQNILEEEMRFEQE